MESLRVLLAIPTYRCALQVRRVLQALRRSERLATRIERVIVIDNQSPDDTAAAAEDQIRLDQQSSWMEVQVNDKNLGLGGSQKRAFDTAIDKSFSHLIVLHGDDQADVDDLHAVLDRLEEGYDAVLGSRFMPESSRQGYSKLRILGNRALNFTYSILTGTRVLDLGSGLNGFRLSAFSERRYRDFSNGFTFNTDLLLDLIREKRRFVFLPISWRETDQVSNARNVKVGWAMLSTLMCWRLGFSKASRGA